MTEDKSRPIKVADIANKLGKNPGIIKKMLVSRNITPFKFKDGQNSPWFISLDDAQRFETLLEDEAAGYIYRLDDVVPEDSSLSGVYVVEVPTFDNHTRIKIGWSDKIAQRISTYRTIVPDLRVIAIWYTNKSHNEQVALDIARNHISNSSRGTQVFQELFEFDDQNVVIEKIKNVFLEMGLKPSTDIQQADSDSSE